MSESVEQIEAKLCAYIEGDLNDAERAQIEAHLAANPSHEQMIRHLMRQKQAIVRLPRERAPADLMDEFQGQLEREVLLKIEPRPLEAPTEVGWGRILSAAAIFVLASGLAIVVYSVLPNGHPALITMDDAAERPRPAPAMPTEAEAMRAAEAADKLSSDAVAMPLARKGTVPETKQLAKSVGAASPAAAQVSPANAGPLALEETQQTLVITVTAADLRQTNEQVLAYLASNNLDYSVADGQVRTDAIAQRRGALFEPTAERMQRDLTYAGRQQPAAKSGEMADAAPPDRQALAAAPLEVRGLHQESVEQQAVQELEPRRSTVPAVPAAAPTRMAFAAPATTQPVDRSVAAGAVAFGGMGGGRGGAEVAGSRAALGLAQQEQPKPEQLALAASAMAENRPSMDSGRVIIVRNINDQQVTDLKNVLFRPGRDEDAAGGRFVRGAEPAEGGGGNAPAAGIQGVADFLTHPSRAIDALEGMFGQWNAPATQPAGRRARPDAQVQVVQAARAAGDGLAVQRLYNCVIVLQNPAASIPAMPATRPATAAPEAGLRIDPADAK